MHMAQIVARALCLLAAATFIRLLSGCIAFPVPRSEHYETWPPGEMERPWDTLKIGETSRRDVRIRFDDPYRRWYADRVWVYRWTTSKMGVIVAVTDLWTGGAAGEFPVTTEHFLFIGFIGSYIAVGLALVLSSASPHALFLALAGSFALFPIPCFLFVRERPNPKAQPLGLATIGDSAREVLHTLRTTRDHPGLLRFLIARMFYSDAVNTVIAVMSLYTIEAAQQFGRTEAAGRRVADLILLFAITFAVLGGIVWGRIVDRLGPKRTLTLVLACWAGALLFAAAIGFFSLPLWTLYVLGALTGVAFAGVSTSDRPFLLRLTPPDCVGEYYGLYGMVGRFAAITGPALWALVTWSATRIVGLTTLRAQAAGILVLLAMMAVGYLILRPVSDRPRLS